MAPAPAYGRRNAAAAKRGMPCPRACVEALAFDHEGLQCFYFSPGSGPGVLYVRRPTPLNPIP